MNVDSLIQNGKTSIESIYEPHEYALVCVSAYVCR